MLKKVLRRGERNAAVRVQNTGEGCIVRLKLALLPCSTYISQRTCIFRFTDGRAFAKALSEYGFG